MASDQASIDKFKTAVAANGPVLADDDAYSQAMDDYSDDAIFKAYLSGKTVLDEMRKTLSPDQSTFLDKVGNLDWIAAALRTTLGRRPLRHDDPRHARQAAEVVERRRGTELRALAAEAAARRTCSPTSASTAPPARSPASRTTRS